MIFLTIINANFKGGSKKRGGGVLGVKTPPKLEICNYNSDEFLTVINANSSGESKKNGMGGVLGVKTPTKSEIFN